MNPIALLVLSVSVNIRLAAVVCCVSSLESSMLHMHLTRYRYSNQINASQPPKSAPNIGHVCLRLPSSVRPVILPRGHAWRVSLPLSWSLAESVEVRKPEEVAADTLRSPSRRIFRQRPPIFMCPGVAIHSGSGVSANSDEAEVSPQQPRRHPPSDCSKSGPSDTGSLWDQPLWCDGGVMESAVMPTICIVSPLIGGWLAVYLYP